MFKLFQVTFAAGAAVPGTNPLPDAPPRLYQRYSARIVQLLLQGAHSTPPPRTTPELVLLNEVVAQAGQPRMKMSVEEKLVRPQAPPAVTYSSVFGVHA